MVRMAKIGVGSRIWWKDEAWSITGLSAGALELVEDRGRHVRADSASLVGTEDYQALKEFTGAPLASEGVVGRNNTSPVAVAAGLLACAT